MTGLKKNPASTHNVILPEMGSWPHTIIFYCVPCSKITSLVFAATYLRPSSDALASLAGHSSLVLVLRGLGKLQKAF